MFNKIDVERHDFVLEWMSDFESYHRALEKDTTYASTWVQSWGRGGGEGAGVARVQYKGRGGVRRRGLQG